MEKIELQVRNREILGKGVKLLRRKGIVPVHLFGHGLDSLALEGDVVKLEQSLAKAGENRLIDLTLQDEKKARPVLVREVQRDALTGKLLHIDFYQVKMAEKMKVKVPVILVGEAPALGMKDNMLVRPLDELNVECLPAKIPEHIRVDITSLTDRGQAIRVKDLSSIPDIAILNDNDEVIVTVVHRFEEKVVEKPKAEVAETPTEETAKAEEKSSQEKA
jgi:large subunit ribosomal protein L25